MRERDIFLAALEFDSATERAAFLDRSCAGETRLRERVEALLRADVASEGFLNSPVAEQRPDTPDRVGPFELQESIGHGGMGVVHRAWDSRLHRHVAIKFLKRRSASDRAAAHRFRHEARITARLQHPGVPPVHEVGDLPDGRPYLAMKLVEGQTMAEMLRLRSNVSDDRGRFVAVFEQICQTMGFAHRQGVIHRDLKPANVMVGAFGEVQVMDWGLAKIFTQDEAPETTVPHPTEPQQQPDIGNTETLAYVSMGEDTPIVGEGTRAGLVLGTPGYMAPEQARGESADPRSDVFGLGALLYEILTGSSPFDGLNTSDKLQANAAGRLDHVRDQLARCGADSELIALCERCLATRPVDRPSDAAEVATDVAALRNRAEERARQAEREQVAAIATAGEERKRRRVQLILGSIAAVALASGAGISVWQTVLARQAETQTRQQLEKTQQAEEAAHNSAREASTAAELARRKEQEAREAAADAKAFGDFLANNFLAATRPADVQLGLGVDVKISDALAKAEADIATVFAGRPLAEARARFEVGVTWRNLGKYDRAETQFRRAIELQESRLGPEHPDTLQSLNSLAVTINIPSNGQVTEPIFRRVLAGYEKAFGPLHPNTLAVANNLGLTLAKLGRRAEAEEVFRRVLKGHEQTLGLDHTETLVTVHHLAGAVANGGDRTAAKDLYRRALAGQEKAVGPDHPRTLDVANGLAVLLRKDGDLATAEQLFRRVLAGREKALGPTHAQTLDTVYGLADTAVDRHDEREALRLYERAYEGWRVTFGPDHEWTLRSACNVAAMYWRLGRHDRSLPLFEEIVQRLSKSRGVDDPVTIELTWTTASNYIQAGRTSEALPFLERAHAASRKHNVPDWVLDSLVQAYIASGRPVDAAGVLSESVATKRQKLSPDRLASLLDLLGQVLTDYDPAAAEPALRESLMLREKIGPNSWVTFNTMSLLGASLARQKKYSDAEPFLLKAYEGLRAREKSIPAAAGGTQKIAEALDRLIMISSALNRLDDVQRWKDERARYPREITPFPRSSHGGGERSAGY